MGRPLSRDLADLDVCLLTTTGRRTGRAHVIEIWFALHGDRVYLLAGGGGRSDWVRNLRLDPVVTLRLGDRELAGTGRVVDEPAEDALARRLLVEKYRTRYGGDLQGWRRTALPVAIDLADTL